jgi:hypothetical protein
MELILKAQAIHTEQYIQIQIQEEHTTVGQIQKHGQVPQMKLYQKQVVFQYQQAQVV